jgi:quercetin dioxygenase-like cupin family protein
VQVECGGRSFRAEPGDLVTFDPDERHAVRNDDAGESRVLLLLAPWPGDGHYRGGGSEPR